MQLFLLPFQHPVEFFVSAGLVGVMLAIFLLAAKSPERRGIRWVKEITSSNSKVLFGLLFVGWAVFFGLLLQVVPHTGANSPYGGLALIALFTGFFVMMGFLWSVIGE